MLDKLLILRRDYAYGQQTDYFYNNDKIGFVRYGNDEHTNSGLAVVMTDKIGGEMIMDMGEKFKNTEFYDYDSKYIDDDGAELNIPAQLSEFELSNIQDVAGRTYRVLDCEGLSRVDVFLTEEGQVIVNEVNTMPGFTSISMYPKLLEASGVSYTELVTQLIILAIARYDVNGELKRSI